jgi:hypothetical protein
MTRFPASGAATSSVSDRPSNEYGRTVPRKAGLRNRRGRRDDTPPGGALAFELWRNRKTGEFSVRCYFTVQTLEQMRSSTTLALSSPPERVPVLLPGCGKDESSCGWPAFKRTIQKAIDLRYVTANR